MPEPIEQYTSQLADRPARRLSVYVWLAGAAIAGIWLAAIVAPPVLAASGGAAPAASIRHFFSYACHQFPDRSLWFLGNPLAVCSRCFGVYFGLLASFLAYPLWRRIDDIEPLPRIWLFLSVVPLAIDWSLTFLGLWENTHLSRFVTGAILGAACGTYIIPALVELGQLMSRRFYAGTRSAAIK